MLCFFVSLEFSRAVLVGIAPERFKTMVGFGTSGDPDDVCHLASNESLTRNFRGWSRTVNLIKFLMNLGTTGFRVNIMNEHEVQVVFDRLQLCGGDTVYTGEFEESLEPIDKVTRFHFVFLSKLVA